MLFSWSVRQPMLSYGIDSWAATPNTVSLATGQGALFGVCAPMPVFCVSAAQHTCACLIVCFVALGYPITATTCHLRAPSLLLVTNSLTL
jgi:hypothetical protein